jgi:hypothetical protein
MITKYYTGNFILGLGVPYVVLSGNDVGALGYRLQKFIIFFGYDGSVNIRTQIVKVPKVLHETLEDFIQAELFFIKEDIFSMINKNFEDRLKQLSFVANIELKESNLNVLLVIAEKEPKFLKYIQKHSFDNALIEKISLVFNLNISREDIK